MCGRYAASSSTDELVEELEVQADHTGEVPTGLLKRPQQPPPGEPDYNMAPTKLARVVLTRAPRSPRTPTTADASDPSSGAPDPSSGAPDPSDPSSDAPGPSDPSPGAPDPPIRQLRLLTWGLVPSWSKDTSGAVRMINARVESVFDKPAYRVAARHRRCLVPASGWYEWQQSPVATDAKGKPLKQPFFVARDDGVPLVFAGLYEFWRDPAAQADDSAAWLTTFTILTQPAEPGLDRIHDRQPVVLDRGRWAAWLDPCRTERPDVEPLVRPRPPGRFRAYPVDRAVGGNRVNGPQLLRALSRDDLRGVVDPMTGEIING